MRRPILVSCVVSLTIGLGISLFFPFAEDPVHRSGTMMVRDNRRHSLEGRTYQETTAIVRRLQGEVDSGDPVKGERALVRLISIQRSRGMIPEAVELLTKGLETYPNSEGLREQKRLLVEIINRPR